MVLYLVCLYDDERLLTIYMSSCPGSPRGWMWQSMQRGDSRGTLLEPQSRSGDKPVKFQAVLSPNGTAVLKGLNKSFSLRACCACRAYYTQTACVYIYPLASHTAFVHNTYLPTHHTFGTLPANKRLHVVVWVNGFWTPQINTAVHVQPDIINVYSYLVRTSRQKKAAKKLSAWSLWFICYGVFVHWIMKITFIPDVIPGLLLLNHLFTGFYTALYV